LAYSIGIGAVAKWLASGFIENRNWAALEQQLIDQGFTPEEARAERDRRQFGD
jgi:hypothetical protein